MESQIFLLTLLFLLVVGLTTGLGWLMSRSTVRARLQRLNERRDTLVPEGAEARNEPLPATNLPSLQLVEATEAIEQIAEPEGGWQQTPLRQRFVKAGLYDSTLPGMFMTVKVVLGLVLFIASFVLLNLLSHEPDPAHNLLLPLLAATLGFLAPEFVLNHRIRRRQDHIRRGLPDATDFLVVCVEAGSALDAAFIRVAQELALSNPALAREMHWVTLEFRAGRSRDQALRNFAERTGVEDVEVLANMLIQADRFGTSTADALRVYADMLRVKRRQQAEETAAKIPVKLLFPLIFFIFPALLVILAGPAMVQIYRVLLPSMGGTS